MANLNTSQIMGAAKSIWGRDIGDQEAQNIMNATKGGEAGEVDFYLKNDPTFLGQKATAERNAINAAQKAQEDDFLNRFKTAIGGQEKLTDAASRIGGELNLPTLRESSNALSASLKGVPEQQRTATRGYNVNSNQLSRIIGAKQAELAPVAQTAITQTQNAESELGTRLGYLTAEQQKELKPFDTEDSMLSDRLAREYSGFTQDKQNELSLIMNAIQNKQQITRDQLAYANELAKLKYQYDNTKTSTDKYLKIGEGDTLIDQSTGLPVYTAPKTYKSSSLSTDSGW